jgi:hypothetical protein
VDAKTDTEVISATLPVTFPDPLQSLRIYMRWMNVVFPRPSEYRFQVWEGHELLMEKRLIVLEPPKEEPEDA